MRTYKRKTDRGNYKEILRCAAQIVITEEKSIREVARDYDLCHVTLYRLVKKLKASNNEGVITLQNVHQRLSDMSVGYIKNRQVFTDEEEAMLVEYIEVASSIFFDLSPNEVRRLAYQCAKEYSIPMPQPWVENEKAGPDWLAGFLKRHKSLSFQSPVLTGLARTANSNKFNVDQFFDKFSKVLEKHNFVAGNIWTVGETSVTTGPMPGHNISQKSVKQVGATTSAERGTLITLCIAVCATGNTVPPMLTFPTVHYKDNFVINGPAGCIGAANKSGTMQEKEFIQFLEHFVRHTRPTTEKPVLLILDNHHSHLTIETIDFVRQNGIVLLSFPSHTNHQLQPLDNGVFDSLKTHLSKAQDLWTKSHPDLKMTVHDLPSIIRDALPKANTFNNIASGFRKCGIVPFDKDIFNDHELAPAHVAERCDTGNMDLNNTSIAEIKTEPVEEDCTPPNFVDYGNNWLSYQVKEEGIEHSSESSQDSFDTASWNFNESPKVSNSSARDYGMVPLPSTSGFDPKQDIKNNSDRSSDSIGGSWDNCKPAAKQSTEPSSIQCGSCNQLFCEAAQFTKHLKFHYGKKMQLCNICGKSFSGSYLIRHLRIHTGEKPHVCRVCSKKFTQSSTLKEHLRIHSGVKSHQCQACGKIFTQSITLKRHLRTHTGDKPHQCEICKKAFTQASSLRRHMMFHSGQKPHSCEFCDKKFADSTNLKAHVRIHTKERPYPCHLCSSAFTQSSSLKRHVMTQHNDVGKER